jgi:hypothetical protein
MSQRDDLVKLAASFIGVSGPDGDDQFIIAFNKYSGRTVPLNADWCSMFASEMLRRVGATAFPYTAGCTDAMHWYKNNGEWHDGGSGYSPAHGNIIYFDWDGVRINNADHVGIIERLDNKIHTIEGNAYDAVRQREYEYDDPRIRGFGVPKFPDESVAPVDPDVALMKFISDRFGFDSQDWWVEVLKGKVQASGSDIRQAFEKIRNGAI